MRDVTHRHDVFKLWIVWGSKMKFSRIITPIIAILCLILTAYSASAAYNESIMLYDSLGTENFRDLHAYADGFYLLADNNIIFYNVTNDSTAFSSGTFSGASRTSAYSSSEQALYVVSTSGIYLRYDIASNTVEDLSGTDIGDWIGTSNGWDTCVMGDTIYFTFASKFAVYNRTTNTTSQITPPAATTVMSLFCDAANNKVYVNTGVYDPSTNTSTALGMLSGAYDYVKSGDIIFYSGASGSFGYFNLTDNSTTSLSGTDTGDWIGGTNTITRVQYDNFGNKLYISTRGNLGTTGTIGVYDFATNITTDLDGTDIYDNWIGITGMSIYGLKWDASSSRLYASTIATGGAGGYLGYYDAASSPCNSLPSIGGNVNLVGDCSVSTMSASTSATVQCNGYKITVTGGGWNGLVNAGGNTLTFDNCIINTTNYGAGVFSNGVTILNNSIVDTVSGGGRGLNNYDWGSSVVVYNSQLYLGGQTNLCNGHLNVYNSNTTGLTYNAWCTANDTVIIDNSNMYWTSGTPTDLIGCGNANATITGNNIYQTVNIGVDGICMWSNTPGRILNFSSNYVEISGNSTGFLGSAQWMGSIADIYDVQNNVFNVSGYVDRVFGLYNNGYVGYRNNTVIGTGSVSIGLIPCANASRNSFVDNSLFDINVTTSLIEFCNGTAQDQVLVSNISANGRDVTIAWGGSSGFAPGIDNAQNYTGEVKSMIDGQGGSGDQYIGKARVDFDDNITINNVKISDAFDAAIRSVTIDSLLIPDAAVTNATVTLIGTYIYDNTSYGILKDGATCITCSNVVFDGFGNVSFRVQGFSNYTITGPPGIISFTADDYSLEEGQTTQLNWTTVDAQDLSLYNGTTTVNVTGLSVYNISPTANTTYTLTATNSYGIVNSNLSIEIIELPDILSFVSNDYDILNGITATLTWNVSNVLDLDLNGNNVTGLTEYNVTPGVNTSYTLTAINAVGSVYANLNVSVYYLGSSLGLGPTLLFSENSGYVVGLGTGSENIVYYFNGSSLSPVFEIISNMSSPARTIEGSSVNDVWVGGDFGFYHYNGINWQHSSYPYSAGVTAPNLTFGSVKDIVIVDSKVGYAITDAGVLLRLYSNYDSRFDDIVSAIGNINVSATVNLTEINLTLSAINITTTEIKDIVLQMNASFSANTTEILNQIAQMNNSVHAKLDSIIQNQTYMQLYLETTLFPIVNATYQNTLLILSQLGIIETNVNATLNIVNQTQQQIINISTDVNELVNKSRRIRAWITV